MSPLKRTGLALVLLAVALPAVPAQEREPRSSLDWAQVRHVVATKGPDGTWRFDVTVEHADSGWDHYADRWQVVHPQTLEVYGERVLLHPHDNEQPFTRSLSGVRIPDGAPRVLVRAACNEHGFGGATVLVDLTAVDGERFEVRG